MTAKAPGPTASPAAIAPWIAQQRDTLLTQRGHAWLLQGPSGLGQWDLALELARAWLCEAPQAQGACGQCTSCHTIDAHTHADLCVLMPEALLIAKGWPLPEKAQAEIDDKKRKPSREIRVEALRDAIEFTQRTNARGRGKVVLVFPAEQMNTITANALLKTLEEPPGQTRFVLASEAAHALLPTIRSRCLGHTMHWPDEATGLSWLQSHGLSATDALAHWRAAGARPQDALQQAQRGPGAAQAWAQLPKALARGDAAALTALADYSPAQLVQTLQKLCHDLMASACRASPRYFAPADLPPTPPIAALSRWAQSLVEAARHAEHPLNAALQLEALVVQAQQTLHSRHTSSAAPPRP